MSSQKEENELSQHKNVSDVTAIIWLVLFFPVGLYLMWVKTNWKQIIKIAVSVFLAVVLLIFLPRIGGDTKDAIAVSTTESTIASMDETTTEATTELTTERSTEKQTEAATRQAVTARPTQPPVIENPQVKATFTVLLNTNTHKYHRNINCSAVKKMNEENKRYVEVTSIEEVVIMGYEPCGICSK